MLQIFSPTGRPGLLVSVRSADEAAIALAGGADLIDVKEPNRGSLGAAEPAIVAAVVDAVAGRVPASAALGELDNFSAARAASLASRAPKLTFAKLGLASCRAQPDWPTRWWQALAELPTTTKPVAVAYADWHSAAAPPPDEVLTVGAALGCAALLIDTWDKSRGTLFDHWAPSQLSTFMARVRERGLAVVLAGSLSGPALLAAIGLRPELVAVRGAVCDSGRTGAICPHRLSDLRQAIAHAYLPSDSNHIKTRPAEALR